MSYLSQRHPMVAEALGLARQWCAGRRVDGTPALHHAVKVAMVTDRHLPDPAPALIAAALLHHAPFLAPADEDLTALLARFGAAVPEVVEALYREHHGQGQSRPEFAEHDRGTPVAIAADHIVTLRSTLKRAAHAADPATYWRAVPAVAARLPRLDAFHRMAAPHLPPGMHGELGYLVVRARQRCAQDAER
jgi:HD domain